MPHTVPPELLPVYVPLAGVVSLKHGSAAGVPAPVVSVSTTVFVPPGPEAVQVQLGGLDTHAELAMPLTEPLVADALSHVDVTEVVLVLLHETV